MGREIYGRERIRTDGFSPTTTEHDVATETSLMKQAMC